MLSRHLLSLLVSLLLVLSPFAPVNVASALASEEHCMMMDMSDDGAVSAVHESASVTHAMPACKHCTGDKCSNTACADQGCSASHILSLLTTARLPVPADMAVRYLALVTNNLPSHPSAPLLQPPV